MARGFPNSRIALAVALASGTAAAVALPVPAFAKEKAASGSKITFSPAFQKAAAELDKAVGESSKNPAIQAASQRAQAAKTPAERQTPAAEIDAALGGADAKLAAAKAAATTPGDKLKTGELMRNVGVLKGDVSQQHEGLVMMLNSGALAPEQSGQIQYYAGATAYQKGDYPTASQYLKAAYDGGYRDPSGQITPLLMDVYKRTNNTAATMAMVNKNMADATASGGKPDETSIRTALQAAYDAKNAAQATDLSATLVRNYPSPQSWTSAIQVVRAMNPLPPQDNLDLMRLMARTNSLSERRDYIEYIQDADPRRFPAETLKIIDRGVSSGKITASDVGDYRSMASGRLAADRASLTGLDRDARAASASGNSVSASADAFLSYDQPAKAEELYRIALGKSGVDQNRVLTRLGIAQIDQGKAAEAQQTFAKVTGPRAAMAKLWTVYAQTKAGGAAPQASAQ